MFLDLSMEKQEYVLEPLIEGYSLFFFAIGNGRGGLPPETLTALDKLTEGDKV